MPAARARPPLSGGAWRAPSSTCWRSSPSCSCSWASSTPRPGCQARLPEHHQPWAGKASLLLLLLLLLLLGGLLPPCLALQLCTFWGPSSCICTQSAAPWRTATLHARAARPLCKAQGFQLRGQPSPDRERTVSRSLSERAACARRVHHHQPDHAADVLQLQPHGIRVGGPGWAERPGHPRS